MTKKGFEQLREGVIEKGLCTACGTCIGVCPTHGIGLEELDGEPSPVLRGKCTQCGICINACPGADVDIPDLEQKALGRGRKTGNSEEQYLGVLAGAHRTWALDHDIRRKGAGGGAVTALLAWALDSGYLDGVLVAGFDQEKPWRTKPFLAKTSSEVRRSAQSKYAVVPTNSLLSEAVKSGCQKIGIVGLPCQIHSLRKLQHGEFAKALGGRVKLLVGLFCASQFYFEGTKHLLVEHAGIRDIGEVEALTYRGGEWPGHLVVGTKEGEKVVDRHQYMYHFLMPGYKRDRCEMCIDWAAELADIAVGDYWVPEAGSKSSACLIRSEAGLNVVNGAVKDGYLATEEIDPSRLYSGIGFELKKHAAAFRLKQRRRFNWPTPEYHLDVDYTPFPREFHLAKESKN